MNFPLSFQFQDAELNRRLIALLKKNAVRHSVDKQGAIHYSPDNVELVENDLISSIRYEVFPSWQILTCPEDWIRCYRDYMARHAIPFTEEIHDGERWFLIPRKYRPHSWKLEEPEAENEVRSAPRGLGEPRRLRPGATNRHR